MQTVITRAHQYMHIFDSNACESFHNSRTKFTDKRLNLRMGFFLGTVLAALGVIYRHQEDRYFQWKVELLERLQLPITGTLDDFVTTHSAHMQISLKRFVLIVVVVVVLFFVDVFCCLPCFHLQEERGRIERQTQCTASNQEKSQQEPKQARKGLVQRQRRNESDQGNNFAGIEATWASNNTKIEEYKES